MMEFGIIALCLGLVTGLLYLAGRQGLAQAQARARAWKQTARWLGLAHLRGPREPVGRLEGRWKGHEVCIKHMHLGHHPSDAIWTTVILGEVVPEGIQIRRMKAGERTGVVTGDPAFDERIYVSGPPILMAAWLDLPMREALLALVEGESGVIDDHAIQRLRTSETLEAELAEAWLNEQVHLAELWTQAAHTSTEAGLLRQVLSDPSPGVRRRCLEWLTQRLPDTPETRQAIEAARADVDPSVRLVAANASPAEAAAPVLADLVLDPLLPSALRQEALNRLVARELTVGEATLRALLAELERLMTHQPELLATVLAHAPRLLPVIEVRQILEAALSPERFEDAQPEALATVIDGLQRLGDAQSVPALNALVEGYRGGTEIGAAARLAIEAIQSRLDPRARGGMSLAQAAQGQVSIHDGGRLMHAEGTPEDKPS